MKNILITGAASGIGRAIAKSLIAKGNQFICFDLKKPDYDCTYFQLDVSDELAIKKAFSDISQLDVLINCAGVYTVGGVESLEFSDIQRTFDVNVTAAFLTAKYALPLLRSNRGAVINIASGLGVVPEAQSPAYCASKAALIMLTKSMALSEAKTGVRVNAVLPGPIDTNMLKNAFDNQQDLDDYLQLNPSGRVGKPEEVAEVVNFLVDAKTSYLNGACIPVDGGETLGGIAT